MVEERLDSILFDIDLSFFSLHDYLSSGNVPSLYIKDSKRNISSRTGFSIKPNLLISVKTMIVSVRPCPK